LPYHLYRATDTIPKKEKQFNALTSPVMLLNIHHNDLHLLSTSMNYLLHTMVNNSLLGHCDNCMSDCLIFGINSSFDNSNNLLVNNLCFRYWRQQRISVNYIARNPVTSFISKIMKTQLEMCAYSNNTCGPRHSSGG
jgi:hypothetical protein